MQQDVDNSRPRHDQRLREAAARPRITRSVVITLVVVTALIGGLAVFQLLIKPAMIKGFLAKAVPPLATISTEVARSEDWVGKLPSVGSLTAVQSIDVTSQIAGVVAGIGFDSGQDVAAGAKLVTLDSAVEQADLANNKAALQQAELDLKRQNTLSTRAYASESVQQAAQAKRDSATALVQRTTALIAQKSIVAPFAGRLGIRKIDLGQYVAPGSAMVTLQALDPIRVDFPVPEQDISKLAIGQKIEVSVDSFPGQIFKGEIESLDARVSVDTRGLLVRARLNNPDKKLLPGMFANVNILADAATARVTVPRTAVTYSLFGDNVYIVKPGAQPEQGGQPAGQVPAQTSQTPGQAQAPGDVVERKFVRVGEARGDRVAILEGVAAGDQVVTSGQLKLQNGARVKVDNSAPLTPQSVRPKI